MKDANSDDAPDVQSMDSAALRPLRNRVKIEDNQEPLTPIPSEIPRVNPHPYEKLGAPYGDSSPFMVRENVACRLVEAQRALMNAHPNYRLLVWDGYRPLDVQDFMVEHSLKSLAHEKGLDPSALSEPEREQLYSEVLKIWAPANRDPKTPPPHSTGAAIDLTIADQTTAPIDMGSEIDVLPPLCLPHYYKESKDSLSQMRHENRVLLNTVMESAGFRRIPYEWWHFSYGDQTWAFIDSHYRGTESLAVYGRV